MNKTKTLLLSGALTLGTVFAAHAQTAVNDDKLIAANTTTSVSNDNSYSVGVADLRGEDFKAAAWQASKASKGSIIVFYIGTNDALANQVRRGASNAKDDGAPVKGMVLSKHKDQSGEDSYYVLVDGVAVTKQIPASHDPKDVIRLATVKYAEKLGIASINTKSSQTVAVNNYD